MNAGPLASSSRGQGEPVLLLHGLFGAARHWQDIARRLAPRCEAITVDLRNHGRSPPAERMDYMAMADDVLALLDARGIACASVVGHSMGGKVAMALALRHPDRVMRLAVVDIAPMAYADSYTPLIDAACRLDLDGVTDRRLADRRLASAIAEPALRAMLLQNLLRNDSGWHWGIGWSGIRASLPALCGFPAELATRHSDLPALFIQGQLSDHVGARGQQAARRHFPAAAFETIDGAGHWVQADRPGALAAVLERWLDGPRQATPSGPPDAAASNSSP